MSNVIPFVLIAIMGLCSIIFHKQITQSVVKWQSKAFDVKYGDRGIKIVERCYLIGGFFFLIIGLLNLIGVLK